MDLLDRLNGTNGHRNGHAPPPPRKSSPPSTRAEVVRACVRLLSAAEPVLTEPVRVIVRHGATRLVFDVSADEVRAILGPPVRPPLTELESDLLAVLTEAESKPAAIATRARKNANSHVYAALRSLADKGYAKKGPRGGYMLA
ncbi:MAG TPA: hypothetical protein VFW33_08670 [Gemmataceae bacterium]|nr:hypothetical protein [Gemmataceae bacterium]